VALVAVALLASASASSAAPDALPRATADRPDEAEGPQVHALYVLPSDRADRGLDTNGTIDASVANWQRWLRGQTFNNGLRLDTFRGNLDVTFVRLARTDAELASRGLFLRDALEDELRARGVVLPGKIYAAYYDGSNTAACGGGAWPPALPGAVAALYLRGTFGPGATCYEPDRSRGEVQIMDFAMLHEVLHTIGFVPACAPNHTRAGHVSDSPRDLMYAGDEPWRPAVLDVGSDDYFHAHILGCAEFAVSRYLDRGFGPAKVRLTVAVSGPGRVLSTPRGLSCSGRCSATFEGGMRVSLRAIPAKGVRFATWGGACRGAKSCRVTLDRARSVEARFRR
jgi:Divergent InlB B-repeat domain